VARYSGNWSFQNTFTANRFVEEAFERIGILAELLTEVHYESAQNSLNLLLSSAWINRGLNLFTINKGMFTIMPGQNIYNLPANFVDIYERECTAFTPVRQLTGTPLASSGVAANAFDSNPATACTQTAPNGNIGFKFDTAQPISYVGINSFVDNTYTIEVQYSQDGTVWYTANEPIPQFYQAGIDVWICLDANPSALFWRIVETDGSTLNIDELYFDTQGVKSRLLGPVSRFTMLANTNRLPPGNSPTTFYINRVVNPTIQLYPIPNDNPAYTNLLFNYVGTIQSIDRLLKRNVPIPPRFFEACCADLAAALAVKFAPDKAQLLQALADAAFTRAAGEDVQKVPMTVTASMRYFRN
jgi:hypothetical protein